MNFDSNILSNLKKDLDNTLENLFSTQDSFKKIDIITEGSSGTPIDSIGAQPSVDRNKLIHLYNHLRNVLYEPDYDIDFQQDQVVIRLKRDKSTGFDYTPYMGAIVEYMIEKNLTITPLPEVKIKKDIAESVDFFGKTAYYDPNNKEIILYVMNRHPKDVMRSFCHEMIHHMQNLENRLGTITTQNVNEDDHLMKLEEEAILLGNKIFRSWEDSVK